MIDLIAETASFNSNMKKASATLNSEAARMRSALQSIETNIESVKNAGKALIAAELTQQLLSTTSAALDYASSLGETAQQLGVTTQDLQVFRYAATQVGIEQEEMDKSLAKLTKTLGMAQLGSKSAAEVFEALGVKVRDSNGHFRTTSDVLPDLANAIGAITDPARRAAIETELFGKAGQKLDTLLADGADGIDQLRVAAKNLGIVLSDDQIQQADATADKLAELKLVLESRIAGVVAENSGAIYKFADALAELADKSLKVIQAWSNNRNLRGLFLANSPQAATNLLGSDSGRQALLAETDRRIDANIANRAAGRGDPALLDREFRALNRIRNTTLSVDRNRARGPAPIAPAHIAIDGLEGSGPGGGGRSRSGGGGRSAAAEAERLKREAEAAQRELSAMFDRFLADHDPAQKALNDFADKMEEIDKLAKAGFLSSDVAGAAKMQLDLGGLGSGTLLPDWDKQFADIQDQLRSFANQGKSDAEEFKTGWQDAAQGTLSALDRLSYGVQNGGVLDVFQGLLDLFLQLGSIGVFGKGLQTNLKAGRGFAGGGYTGNGGIGDVAGVVHGREYVFDAAATSRIGVANLDRIRRGEGARMASDMGARADRAMAGVSPSRVEVVPSPYFDAVVRGHAAAVAAPAATGAALAGADLAQQRMTRRARNRLR